MTSANPIYDSIQYVKSVGPKRAESFKKIGINRIKDLLYFFPAKHLDRSTIINSSQVVNYLVKGYSGEVTIIGTVLDTELIQYGKKRIFKVSFKDEGGFFEGVWFQGIKYFKDKFKENEVYAISAKPVITKFGHLQFTHPDFDHLSGEESRDFLHTGKIIPFYKIPNILKSSNIGDWGLRKIILNAVNNYSHLLPETLPNFILKDKNLFNISEAVKNFHFPNNLKLLQKSKERFKYEELFYIECLVALKKFHRKTHFEGIKFKVESKIIIQFINKLPFNLTESQLTVLSEIRRDMESPEPMNRLLQGDVGSGKTIVAIIAMLIACTNKYQSIFMVPTEILANQHYKYLAHIMKEFDVNIGLLIGGQNRKDRDTILNNIQTGKVDIVVGTHALLEEPVIFNKAGMVVIDEQHRFGVLQKAKLVSKGKKPDILVMTATPIPRALTLTIYGDLDISTITQLPKSRKKITTALRKESKLPEIYKFIKDKILEGYQTYIVYPLVEESEKINLKAAESYYTSLKKSYFSDYNVSLLHGKMHWREKDDIMEKFAKKKIDILISTTVIEVGIDVPDANIILINDAERFGLSQLHQLRGRVGRSDKKAYCILVTSLDKAINADKFNFDFEYMSRSQIEKNKAIIRLSAMVNSSDGFELSEVDMKLRGPGDIFGTKQSGFPELKFADIIEDKPMLIDAKNIAFDIISNDPELCKKNNDIIKKIITTEYANRIAYSDIA